MLTVEDTCQGVKNIFFNNCITMRPMSFNVLFLIKKSMKVQHNKDRNSN